MLLNCDVGEDSWESLRQQEIHPEYSLEGLMLKLKLWYFSYLMRRTDSFEKDPDDGKDWRREEKGTTEDEMVGWHHQLNGYEFEQTPGDSRGQGSLACCSPWGCKESDTTEWLNWTELSWYMYLCMNLSSIQPMSLVLSEFIILCRSNR